MMLLAALVAILSLPQSIPADRLRDLRIRLVEEINRDRRAAGVPPVEFSEELSRAADRHCWDMLSENYVSHWDRDGLTPYMRYSLAGIRDSTQENIWGLWKSHLDTSFAPLWDEIVSGHRSFMAERPPSDGHRKSILSPRHTHVGIGLAYNQQGVRLIEVFGARYVALNSLPSRSTLQGKVRVEGKVLNQDLKLFGIAIYYDPPPAPMSRAALQSAHSYGLPQEEVMEKPWLEKGIYTDGSQGSVYLGADGRFSMDLQFWKRAPGVYTIGVWLQEKSGGQPFFGGMASIFVEENKQDNR